MDYVAWLKDQMDARGWSQRDLARASGIHESVVSRILRGTRRLKTSELNSFAFALGQKTPPPSTAKLALHQDPMLQRTISVSTIPVRVVIADGVWRERESLVFDKTQVPGSPDPRLTHFEQYACRIDGPEYGSLTGQYAVCINYFDLRSAPTEPDTVHVVRSRGDLQEHSIRCLEVRSGQVLLAPLEYDRPSIPIDADTEIRGLVVGIFRPIRY